MKDNQEWRINFLMISFFLIGGIIIARLFSLQILNYDDYYAQAQNQHNLNQEILPERGEIYIQDFSNSSLENRLSLLAANKKFYHIYLVPKNVLAKEKEELVNQLSKILDLKEEDISVRASKKDDPYEPLAYKVNEEKAEEISKLEFAGIGIMPEYHRYYPYDSLACHITGFLGQKDNEKVGQYGLENYFENQLKGEAGIFIGEKDTSGYEIPSFDQELKPAKDGVDIVLTIEENIQFKAEKELQKAIEEQKAESGTIIIMEPKSGAIRAMASYPYFDPNNYNEVENIDVFLNPAIQKLYEPGSVFKPITMAVGIDSGKINTETTYLDKGFLQIGEYTIKNVDGKAYGHPTMTEVLEKSINTGAVFVQKEVGTKIFQEYISDFRMGEPTGISLSGEIGGDINNLFTNREINLANISFGQGISVTPLGLIRGLAAIANEGNLIRPFIVEKTIEADGTEKITEPEIIERIISKETAHEITKMLVSVVENGFGKPAAIEGYQIAGKTGTAQVPEKGGYSEETIHTFVGFAPAFNPQFIILVKLDKPQETRFAADSVSPVFKELSQYLLNYLEIKPE